MSTTEESAPQEPSSTTVVSRRKTRRWLVHVGLQAGVLLATFLAVIVLGKPYVEFTVDRESAARFGMTMQMVNEIVETAPGGMNLANLSSIEDIRHATIEAGKRRIRPCLMTTATTLAALVPVLVSTGRGADVARAMALPVFGGMVVELITLFVVPVVFCGNKEFKMHLGLADRHWAGVDATLRPDQLI